MVIGLAYNGHLVCLHLPPDRFEAVGAEMERGVERGTGAAAPIGEARKSRSGNAPRQ